MLGSCVLMLSTSIGFAAFYLGHRKRAEKKGDHIQKQLGSHVMTLTQEEIQAQPEGKKQGNVVVVVKEQESGSNQDESGSSEQKEDQIVIVANDPMMNDVQTVPEDDPEIHNESSELFSDEDESDEKEHEMETGKVTDGVAGRQTIGTNTQRVGKKIEVKMEWEGEKTTTSGCDV